MGITKGKNIVKRILLSAVTLMAITSVNAQITNGNVDVWANGEPSDWLYDFGTGAGTVAGTNNFLVSIGEGDPATTTELTGGAAAGGTGSSALLSTLDGVGAIAIAGGFQQITGMLISSWPYTSAPLTADFEYQSAVMATDSSIIQVRLKDAGGSTIAYALMILTPADATTGWTAASVPFTYIGSDAVASIEIWAQSSIGDVYVDGTTLAVDNFVMNGVTGVDEFELTSSVYPNPATDVLNINMNVKISTVSIIAMDGKVISTHDVNAMSTTVEIATLNSGVYMYQIVGADGTIVRESFVKN